MLKDAITDFLSKTVDLWDETNNPDLLRTMANLHDSMAEHGMKKAILSDIRNAIEHCSPGYALGYFTTEALPENDDDS